jgi:RNA-directed DNA polymerase
LKESAEQLFKELDRPTPVSYAYRPGKLAQQAAQAVLSYVRSGYTHVLDADLAKFFDTIPRDALLARCRQWLNGNPLTFSLVHRFLCVDRVPFVSYAWDAHGKPLGPQVFQRLSPHQYAGDPRPGEPQRYSPSKGIPQGGVLSGLLANLYLHPFDQWIQCELAPEFDLQYVRYADDFVVLARSEVAVLQAYEKINEKVEAPPKSGGLGLAMYPLNVTDPSSPDSKTRYMDLARMPLWFVGFEISGVGRNAQLRIKPKNVERFVKRWTRLLDSEKELVGTLPGPKDRLKKVIQTRLRPKILGYRWVERCSICGEHWVQSRSWISFYRCTTDWRQVLELDQRLRKIIYRRFRDLLPGLTRADLTEMGLPSLMREYRRARRMRCGCKCEPSARNCRDFRKHSIHERLRTWMNDHA